MTTFYSVDRPRSSEIKLSRSRFICSLAPAAELEEAKAFIGSIASRHPAANHNCWAYIIGDRAEISHCSDNGEPSGSAGRPMLNTLNAAGLTRVACVVTRYFGGTKLGIRGLINAYSLAVSQTLDLEPLVRIVRKQTLRIQVDYAFNDSLLHRLGGYRAVVTDTVYAESVTHQVDVELTDIPAVEALLTAFAGEGKLTFSDPSET